jgi:hypothetical protein
MTGMESDYIGQHYTARGLGYEDADRYLEDPRPEHRNLETYDLIFAPRPPLAITIAGKRLLRDWLDCNHQDLDTRAEARDALWDGDWMLHDTRLTHDATVLIFETLDRLEAASR